MFNISIVDKKSLLAILVSNVSTIVDIETVADNEFSNKIHNFYKAAIDLGIKDLVDFDIKLADVDAGIYLIRISEDQFAMATVVNTEHYELLAEKVSEAADQYKSNQNISKSENLLKDKLDEIMDTFAEQEIQITVRDVSLEDTIELFDIAGSGINEELVTTAENARYIIKANKPDDHNETTDLSITIIPDSYDRYHHPHDNNG